MKRRITYGSPYTYILTRQVSSGISGRKPSGVRWLCTRADKDCVSASQLWKHLCLGKYSYSFVVCIVNGSPYTYILTRQVSSGISGRKPSGVRWLCARADKDCVSASQLWKHLCLGKYSYSFVVCIVIVLYKNHVRDHVNRRPNSRDCVCDSYYTCIISSRHGFWHRL